MKINLFPKVIVVCLGLMLTINAFAQEQMSKGQLFAIHQDIVMPAKIADYEKAAKNLAGLFAEHNMTNMPYTTLSTEDYIYSYVMPVENYAALDKMETSFNELQEKMGEETFMNAMKQFDGTYTSSKSFIVRLHQDLSYNANYGNNPSEGMNFRHWDFYFVEGGKDQDAMEIAGKWKALFEKHSITEGYRLYTGEWGTEMPVIIVVQSARNASEFYASSQKHMETFGEEGTELMQETMAIVRKFDTKDGAVRPDLSYQPTPVATADEQ